MSGLGMDDYICDVMSGLGMDHFICGVMSGFGMDDYICGVMSGLDPGTSPLGCNIEPNEIQGYPVIKSCRYTQRLDTWAITSTLYPYGHLLEWEDKFIYTAVLGTVVCLNFPMQLATGSWLETT
ncbi:hypothetical protein CHS0354_018290 [Potamilus streckersoni]|uniref:Uncharacterized protein n=1 Tax=Potamilus streckersoni TaxID=2493646 RepID=A0AAE0WFW8_9BIVA|nr:hypothetical protein CHS0354_018290 [Potamilus streckersoni]